ncbi:pyridoxamine 5'-phosphate oxidase family protein [Aeromicrobium sp. 9AM]|uniref:pyridoxamine 5'-phosphate oxidase family protein n=1 Tax=Aeromicrobium sp. 9AM TaxID=2653126 RepID=UPI0012EF2661|nr:pyridoxamine 5'-phosphate oxidase family protein [Aeromicrobium sp. 9AM]VXC03940.1 Pyridoxamine 5'-phosphate oxidase [Aeromicrobium sp. 9AM]
MESDDLTAHAQALIDGNAYLTLGTVDRHGRPWITPVYFAADGLRDFYWMSSMDARHSRNLSVQSEVSLVVFDSTVPPYHGRALYAATAAREVPNDDLVGALEVYPGPVERGGSVLTTEEVSGASPWRLYCATASDLWVLCPRAPRQPCPLHGRADDHRTRIA